MKKLLVIIIVLGLGFFGYTYTSTPASGDEQGGIHIEVIDQDKSVVVDDYYVFEEETSLFELLNENYTIGCADSSFELDENCDFIMLNSHVLLSIESVETDWYSSFIEITIDGVKSQYGVDSILLKDEMTVTLTYTSLGGDE